MFYYNRCILCGLCVRVSKYEDQKSVFAISGRGMDSRLVFNSPSGKLGDTDFSPTDQAASVCPVGAILPKYQGYETPIGERLYDGKPINMVGDAVARETAKQKLTNGGPNE